MKAYLIIYPADGSSAASIRLGMEKFKLVEHISDHSSIIISFFGEEDILEHLQKFNKERTPMFVLQLSSGIHTANVEPAYFEPTTSEKI